MSDYFARPIRTSRDSFDYGNTRLEREESHLWALVLGVAASVVAVVFLFPFVAAVM